MENEKTSINFYEVDLADPMESFGLTPEDLKVGDLMLPETLSPLQLRCKRGLDAGRIVIMNSDGYLRIQVPAGYKVVTVGEILPPGCAHGRMYSLVPRGGSNPSPSAFLGSEHAGN